MAARLRSRFLGPVDDATKQQLGQVLWNWKLCGQCNAKSCCGDSACPSSMRNDLGTFWSTYERMTDAYSLAHQGRKAALNSHKELVDIIEMIKNKPDMPREELRQIVFEDGPASGNDSQPETQDQRLAFRIAASALLLMDFSTLRDPANITPGLAAPIPWRDTVSRAVFVGAAFHCKPLDLDLQNILVELKAKNFRKHARLRLEATNDIRRHLVLSKKEKTLWVFHQTTALRQLLSMAENSETESGTDSCILPRDVILEILQTIHGVLFPLDPGSQKLLKRLVNTHDWDKGLLSDNTIPRRKSDDAAVSFPYFGQRLIELHAELQKPTPHGWMQRRLKRRNDDYTRMATIYGVIIALTFAFLSLVIGIFQSWVAWQQWKHPIH